MLGNEERSSLLKITAKQRVERAERVCDIRIDALGKRYGGHDRSLLALDGVSMLVPAGHVTAIVGPSGCGKSTLLMITAGLEQASEGAVYVGGDKVDRPFDGLGFAFQRDLLMPQRTVLDNILLQIELLGGNRRTYEDRARALVHLVGLDGFEYFYPKALSGGMRQRVALCRALIHEPTVLLLDEPFAAVDALTREDLAVQMEQLFVDISLPTTLLVTHSIDEAVFMSDRVYVLSAQPGRVVGCVDIRLPRPRKASYRTDPTYFETVAKIRSLLRAG